MNNKKKVKILIFLFSFVISGCFISFFLIESEPLKSLDNKISQKSSSLKLSSAPIELKWSHNTSHFVKSVAISSDGKYIVAGNGYIAMVNDADA